MKVNREVEDLFTEACRVLARTTRKYPVNISSINDIMRHRDRCAAPGWLVDMCVGCEGVGGCCGLGCEGEGRVLVLRLEVGPCPSTGASTLTDAAVQAGVAQIRVQQGGKKV